MCPGGELSFNTVQTLLRIMDKKGLVSHRAQGRIFVYTARHSRESEASGFLKRVFDNSLDQFVLSLLKTRRPSDAELAELERIIAQARKERTTRSRGDTFEE
jgi:BlaI family transcriptional regulator, penicillinase repressor